ncbi:GNAT family N-acetyltransferase [Glutamicibacter halophytocola]|uniref:GNAT family N-acetyltransferase n=1 Tax=Glutamicibacter halophytocola TaxID=1933880 RepID=UPI0015C566AC|nr:GNAT family N-acetyltransferase [Glutamicibacter halophytocola]NQD41587.1 GNAT family N-acetyltransferase [Glutamicibacter halophytocola]
MTDLSISVVAHGALTAGDVDDLRRLFDQEYLHDFGYWIPNQPYGYAPHDFHVIARSVDSVVGHVGWERRTIGVGHAEVVIAGVGGVLISERARGERLGKRLMTRAAQLMLDAGGIDFGYLGCREEVVPFYKSCGWSRVMAAERSIGRDGLAAEDPPGQPLLVLPIASEISAWPAGTIDLRGRAW